MARDAARNAVNDDSALANTSSETAKKVVIVFNPSDRDNDALPEASNAQAVRIASPFKKSCLGKVRNEPLTGVFKIDPKLIHRKIEDMEEGASNVSENVAMNGALQDFRLKTDPSILKLFPKPKSVESGLKNIFKLRESNLKLHSINDSPKKLSIAPAFKKSPEFKLSSTLKKLSESKPLKPQNLIVPKWSASSSRKQVNIDSQTLSSNVDERFIEATKASKVPRLGLPSLLPVDLSATRKAPFAFKNLLKLKDVELMSPRLTKVKIEIPALKPVTRLNDKLISSPVNKDCNIEQTSTQSKVQLIPRGKSAKTEILDALPSASENNEVITEPNESSLQQDNLSNVSENNEVVTTDENPLEPQESSVENFNGNVFMGTGQQFSDNSEEGTISNEQNDAKLSQSIKQTSTLQLSKVPEDGEQFDFSDDSFEVIIDENGASGIDQMIFDVENEPLNSEINIGEENIPEEVELNEGLDITGQDIDESLFSEGSNFRGIINRDEGLITNEHTVAPDSLILEKEVENEAGVLADFSGTAKCGCEARNIPGAENQTNDENRNAETLKEEELPRINKLSNLKERFVLRLHNLQKPNGEILSLSRLTKQDDKNTTGNIERSSMDGISVVEREPTKIFEKSIHDIDDGVNTEDLQDDDQEVRASTNFEFKVDSTQNPNDSMQLNDENETFDSNSGVKTHISDSETLDSTHVTETFEPVTDSSVPFEHIDINANDNVANTDFNESVAQNLNKKSTCQDPIDSFKSVTSNEAIEETATETKPQEMAVEASEHRASIFPTLTQQVLEPTSLFHNSMLDPPVLPSLGDLLNGNSQLPPVPSLDDITSSISNLFKGNEKATSEQDLSSSEFDPNTDCTDDIPVMSTGASTTNTKSIISGLHNPLENINLDIFQLSPLSRSTPLAYKIPSLNLNSFKTKLAIPKMLDIKPVKLQSSLGKDGSLFGATLTFEPSKLGALNARKPMTSSSALNLKPLMILGNTPDLGGLRSNHDNLLRKPLTIPTINPLETLKATKTLGDNIRSHTENTVRNLQQSLASTLNEARVNNAGEKLAKPKVDLLELVSNAHEDMQDKLLGIHTDLQDRLETLQDHIKEQTNFPMLTMPRLPNLLKLESPCSETTISSNLRASQPSKSTKSQRKPGFRVNKPSQLSRTVQEKPVNQQANLKPFKMSKAASSLTPKSVEVPKLIATSVKPPFAKPLERHSNVKLRKSTLMPVKEPARYNENEKSSLILRKNGQTRSSSRRLSTDGNDGSLSKLSRPKPQPRFNVKDTSGFASEVKSSRIKPNTRSKDVLLDPNNTQLRSSSWQVSSARTSTEKTVNLPSFRDLRVKVSLSSEKLPELKKPALTLSKSTESPLIAKLRESLNPKLSSPKHRSEGAQVTNDMAKSASEDNAVVLSQEPMKENVSYKCKMVCFKEP